MSGFLVDMAKVFEDFLTATLTRSLEALGGTCRAQDPHALDVAGRMKMDPDLVWYRGGHPATVVDAKYKAEKPAGFLDADVYQLLAHCTALDLAAGHLVYAKGNEPTVTHRIRDSGVTIHAHALDLAATPDAPLADVDRLAYRMDGPSAQTAALPEERSARPPDSTRTLDACVADRAPLSHAPSTRWALRSGRPPGRSCRRPFRRHGLVDGHTRPPSPD